MNLWLWKYGCYDGELMGPDDFLVSELAELNIMPVVLDIAQDPTPHLAAFKSLGVKSIFSYISSIQPNGDKCWSVPRVKAAAAEGFRIGIVHEGWGGVDGRGITGPDGTRDGHFAVRIAPVLGAPKGATIYFACDWDFTTAQIHSEVFAYFRAIRAAMSPAGVELTAASLPYKIGVYGSGAVCSELKAAGLVEMTWLAQSRGWLGFGEWLSKADITQGPDSHINNADLDPDTPHGDIGDYVPVWPQAEALEV